MLGTHSFNFLSISDFKFHGNIRHVEPLVCVLLELSRIFFTSSTELTLNPEPGRYFPCLLKLSSITPIKSRSSSSIWAKKVTTFAGAPYPKNFVPILEIKSSVICITDDLISNSGTNFFGYGAPAKVVTFLAQMELENLDLIGVIDDNLSKQGKFLPGSGFKISSAEEVKNSLLSSNKTHANGSTCLIFPWNLKFEILQKLKEWVPSHSNAVLFFPKVEKVDI